MSIISGLNSLAYTGVEARTPPQFVVYNRAPTPNDYDNFNLGTIWLYKETKNVWMLVSKAMGVSIWAQFDASLGTVTGLRADDTVVAFPVDGVIDIMGGSNINTTAAGNTVTINLDNNVIISGSYTTTGGNINLSTTNAGGTEGVISFGGLPVVSLYGGSNIFVGEESGNFTLSPLIAVGNSGFGNAVLARLATGSYNTSLGYGSATLLSSGSGNVMYGANSGLNLLSGSNNMLLGFMTGSAYTGAESLNILIGSNVSGVLGESAVTRIGLQGTQTAAYIAGAYGVTTVSGTTSALLISNTGQLGTVSSSRRFKENISSMSDQSSAMMSLRPVTFNFKADESKTKQFGLIAEEVYEKMPAIVNLDDEGNPISVRYHEMPSILLNELQKLSKRISSLEEQLTAFKNK